MATSAAYLIASTVISAASAVAQGASTRQQMRNQAITQENEAKLALTNAQLAQRDAAAEAEAVDQEKRRALAMGVAAGGASGVDFSGSFSDTQFDTALSYDLKKADIKYKGEVEGYNYRTRAMNSMFSAKSSRKAGNTALTLGIISAVSSVASGVSSYKNRPIPAGKTN